MIYLAGPLFTMAEINFNQNLAKSLEKRNLEIYLPQHECKECISNDEIYETCIRGLEICDTIVAVLDGTDADSGTSFEIGYGRALKRKIIGLRTDFRNTGDDGGLNLMLTKGCDYVLYHSALDQELSFDILADKIIKLL